MKKLIIVAVLLFFQVQISLATTYYVNTTGSDANGDGSIAKPWRTLMFAVTKVVAGNGDTIQLAAGTFVENGLVEVPLGVNIIGAGIDQTILKAASSFYYHPADPGYSTDKYLISLNQYNPSNGNQTLSGFTIDGDSKQLHGGIYVRYRSFVIIDKVKVLNTNFNGIWLWDVKDSKLINSQLINCAWGSTSYCSGTLNLGNIERVEVSQLNVDENTGYGIKAIGPDGGSDILSSSIHDSHISVTPYGLWNNGSAPNIAIELWQVNLVGNSLYNCYVDNTISLVNANAIPSTGIQTIRVHHNIIDLDTRAQGNGYGIELTIHDAEVDHNYFIKGSYGLANWSNPMINWSIHHNTFYALQGIYPGEVVRSQWSGLHNVKLYNNTVEFASDKTMNVVGLYGGTSDGVDVQNNLFINNNTSYNYYPDQFVHMENNATLTNLTANNNLFYKLPIGSVPGTYQNNLTVDPQITLSGARPDPYYMPKAGSPLIDAGANLGFPYVGSAPDIGALEYTSVANVPPTVSITSPANNSSFNSGSSIAMTASATDSDGTIAKVEFYNGTTLLGQSLTSPYSFNWTNVPAGNYSLTAKATDNSGAATTSIAVAISVVYANVPPTVSITSPANNTSFKSGSSITITAIASDSDGTIAKVEFYNGTTLLGQSLTSPYSFTWAKVPAGSYSLTAKATDNSGVATTSSSINITVKANIPPVVSITSPVKNASFTSGSSIAITASASDSDGTIAKVRFYSGTTLLGQSTTSPYTITWANVPVGNYSLTAKATDNNGAVTTSSAVTISVVAPNALPSVSITSPTNNATFTSGSSVTISANATDSDGTITKVEFYNGATLLGQSVISPYSFTWSNIPAGSYSLTAKATDNSGGSTTSAAVTISIVAPNALPSVSITNPTNNATFTSGASVTISANATDSDGAIAKVEFYNGTTLLGQSLTSPYSFTWSNIPAGSYSLTAKATDNNGGSTISTAVTISVSNTSSSTSSSTLIYLGFDSSDASLSGQMTQGSDATAGMGSYFYVPTGNGTNYYIPPSAIATFNFNLPIADNFVIWARVKSPSSENQTHYIYNGKGKWWAWSSGIHTSWTWAKITDGGTDAIFSFTSGLNSIEMGWFDENAQVDQIMITNDTSYIPTDNPFTTNEFAVYPNPVVTNTFSIQYTSSVAQQAQVAFYNSSSMLVKQINIDLATGTNEVPVDISDITNGIYILIFQPTVSGEKITTRISISK